MAVVDAHAEASDGGIVVRVEVLFLRVLLYGFLVKVDGNVVLLPHNLDDFLGEISFELLLALMDQTGHVSLGYFADYAVDT